jgi:hypothetical protein
MCFERGECAVKYADEFRRWLAEKRKEHRDEVSIIDAFADAFTLMRKLGYERALSVHSTPWVVEATKQLYEKFAAEVDDGVRQV